jgi:hypothetical protein
MSTSTLAILLIVALLSIVIGARADKRISSKTQAMRDCVARVTGRQSEPDALPRVSRNRWERRDLSRMLMTEDDRLSHITNPR